MELHVKKIVEELFISHYDEEATWPDTTDCDRLDRAFAELESVGILSRQDYSCCLSCGYRNLEEETDKLGRHKYRGYVFYHIQDTHIAVRGGGLYLGYRATGGGDDADVEIGRETAAALQVNGLRVDRDEDIKHRIGVLLDWKRRR